MLKRLLCFLLLPILCQAQPKTLEKLQAVQIGMTTAQIKALLGDPQSVDTKTTAAGMVQVARYRMGQLIERFDGGASAFAAGFRNRMAARAGQTQANMGDIELVFVDKVLTETRGFEHGMDKLPAVSPTATKALVVDIPRIYDHCAKTIAFNTTIADKDKAAQTKVDAMNRDGNALVEEYRQAKLVFDKATGDARKEAERRAQDLLARIQGKQKEVRDFIATTRESLAAEVKRFQQSMLKEILAAVEQHRLAGGFEAAYDANQQMDFGLPHLPSNVAATDATDAVLASVNR